MSAVTGGGQRAACSSGDGGSEQYTELVIKLWAH
jgi:hypothetical protein